MTRAPLVCTTVLLLACPAKDTPPTGHAKAGTKTASSPKADATATTDTKTDAKATTDTKADAKATTDTKAKAPPADPAKIAEARKLYLKRLNEGRRLTKDKQYTEAIAIYLQALDVDPSDVALLGELGWAAFKGGDLSGARHSTTHGLRFARTDDQRGMLTYNLGRIAEAEGNPTRAAELYRESLGYRDHDTVRKRLATLAAPPPVPAPTVGLAREAEGVPTVDKACEIVIRAYCDDWRVYTDEPCECEPTLNKSDPGAWAGVLKMTASMAQELYFPVVETPAGLVVMEMVLDSYNPGAFGVYGDIELTTQEVVPDLLGPGKPGWHLAFRKDRADRDMGLNEIEYEHWIGHVFCAREGNKARCTQPVLVEHAYDREVEFPDQDEPGMDHGDLPITYRYKDEIRWAAGALTITAGERKDTTRIDDDMTPGRSLAAGEHSLRGLMGL